jgi:P-type conjugative transfer ATPase TrbB
MPGPVLSPLALHLGFLTEMMRRHLGPGIVESLTNPDITEIYVNPDGRVRFDTHSRGRVASDETLEPHRIESFLNAVSSLLEVRLDASHPTLSAELPAETFRGARLQGFVPPVVQAPAFVIRIPSARAYSLDELVALGCLSDAQRRVLSDGIRERLNILVAGGTNTGKTTFVNALLAELAALCPTDRIVLLEDTVELKVGVEDHLRLRTTAECSLASLVKEALRASPMRIVVGEVRDVAAADLLEAWSTGHPGGMATVHASDPLGALNRLERLAQRTAHPQRVLVAEAVHLIVFLEIAAGARRVRSLARIRGLDERGEYRVEILSPSSSNGETSHDT